jgi:hypothetical protein
MAKETIQSYLSAIPDKRISKLLSDLFKKLYPSDPLGGTTALTGASIAVTPALAGGAPNVLNTVTGSALALPVASGSGLVYRFVMGVTLSGPTTFTIPVGNTLTGAATLVGPSGANFAPNGTTNRVVTFNGTTSGGSVGDEVVFTDIAPNLWQVKIAAKAIGAATTPFSG